MNWKRRGGMQRKLRTTDRKFISKIVGGQILQLDVFSESLFIKQKALEKSEKRVSSESMMVFRKSNFIEKHTG